MAERVKLFNGTFWTQVPLGGANGVAKAGPDGKPFRSLRSTTASITVDAADDIVVVGALSGPVTITLPASPANGQTHVVKDSTGVAATHNITVSGNGSNIDSAATFVINVNYTALTVAWTGSRWNIV